MPKKYTSEQKTEYFAGLRAEWSEAKRLASQNDRLGAILLQLEQMGIPELSLANVQLILMQAEEQGLDGVPYVDFKTYDYWLKAGFRVKAGEKSTIHSIVWVDPAKKGQKAEVVPAHDKEVRSRALIPKRTALFHASQVEPIIKVEGGNA